MLPKYFLNLYIFPVEFIALIGVMETGSSLKWLDQSMYNQGWTSLL